MPSKVQPSGVHAIMAIDPGGTTGVVTGMVRIESTFKKTIATLERRVALEVKGDYVEQARQLADVYGEWSMTSLNLNVPVPNRHVVGEDFVLRGATRPDLTSIWVAAAFHGAIGLDVPLHYLTAGEGKAFASDARLRRWGLWERGSAHKRSAWRMFCGYANKRLVP